ncbi:MAG TPA: polymer-forming cytoskeletal protein [Polyangiaceae bacterium]|jgi:cytoskeletal protein CcmA (bactofilin family)
MAQAKTSAARHVPVRSGSRDAGVLGTSVRIRGKISGEGDLQILGSVEGDVVVRGDLTIGESAHIETENLEAQAVTIQGEVKGDVNATGPVRLGRTARVHGDLKGSEISIEEGAQFAGRIEADFELPASLGSSAPARRADGK